jgi:acetyl-CoA synthetase
MMKNAAAGEQGIAIKDPAIDNIEKLSFTGEPLDSATAEWARVFFGHSVCSIYGTTELGVVIADYPGAPDHRVKPGALGRPVPGVELAIHDARGRDCPPGVAGDIVVSRGGAWVPTRDRGHVDEEGYYYHGGRSDDVIISAGWTMSAVEIEDVLLKHEDVTEAAVIGVPDQLRGLVVKAFIVSPRHGDNNFASELQAFVQQRLSRHEYPRLVAFTDALPKTEAGKINRKSLRDAEPEQRKENLS